MARWQLRLGLSGWDVRVQFSQRAPDDNCRGRCHIWWARHIAVIELDPALPAPVFEQVIVHELLHIVVDGVERAVEDFHYRLPKAVRRLRRNILKESAHAAIYALTFAFTGQQVMSYADGNPVWNEAFPVIEPWEAAVEWPEFGPVTAADYARSGPTA